jgi:ketosteroid isomerase-like protein
MVEDTSHEMSTESLETLTRTYAAWRAGRPEEALAWLDPEVVWTAIEDAPDAGTYRGPDGVLTYMNDWLQDFEDLRVDFEEVIEGEDCIVAVQRGRGRGKTSGVEVDIRYAVVYEFRNRKILRVREFRSKELALEAAGLRE